MNQFSVIFAAALAVTICGQVEGLKCYSCDYTVAGGITLGEPSCENGKTPAAHLVADCTGDQTVCMLMFTDTNYGGTPSQMTRRFCSTQPNTPTGCTKGKPPAPAEGSVVSCWCDKEKCNGGSIDDMDNQGDSSSTKLAVSLFSTLLFIVIAIKSMF